MVGRQSQSTRFYSRVLLGAQFRFREGKAAAGGVYVYETDQGIQGFLGLSGEYIEGLFVSEEAQAHGIGKCLLDDAKDRKPALRLNVYQKNTRAIRFYRREGFQIQCEGLDADTGEPDCEMIWRRD